ncbi:MAG: formylglycine-generating enzyme family protein [Odoribacter sp.]|nr:formylglycine-generating enzyme family protein [Odoribacter sp.]
MRLTVLLLLCLFLFGFRQKQLDEEVFVFETVNKSLLNRKSEIGRDIPVLARGMVVFGEDFIETAFGINMKMVYVKGGDFLMGGTSEQGTKADDDEKPIRRVMLDSYYIGAFEVTQGQWEKVMLSTVSQQRDKMGKNARLFGVGPDYPMYYVSWEEAQAFCQELSRKTGKTYCLPTEAQWEYAARGGSKSEGTMYSGSQFIDEVAWWYCHKTHPIGTKRPNELGLYDMSGNVWEWCQDWYGDYHTDDVQNPTGSSSGWHRVLRGGSCFAGEEGCRVSFRGYYRSDRYPVGGFRVVIIP